ncbi:hypothetical protein CDAR_50731, partial [Caerostris darwini]
QIEDYLRHIRYKRGSEVLEISVSTLRTHLFV